MHLFRRERGKSIREWKARLRPKDGISAGAGPVSLEFSLLKDEPQSGNWQSGLITSTGVHKPSYSAFQKLAQ